MKNGIRVALVGAIVAVGLMGCHSKDDVSFAAIRNRPAPEMQATANSKVDAQRNYAYMRNTNYRGLIDDFNRAFYIDNPSHLSPYPVVDTSGNPR